VTAPAATHTVAREGEHDCKTAEELFEKLSPRHAYWQPDPSLWIFRGIGDVRHPLIAKAHRSGGFSDFGYDLGRDAGFSKRDDVMEELLERFRAALDRAGLPIPARDRLGRSDGGTWGSRISQYDVPLLVLAQHYGLPTPLLDWTSQGRVAAYFAAASAANESARDGSLAVWGMRRDFERHWIMSEDSSNRWLASVNVISAPRASNPNLHAQSGVLTWLWGEQAHTMTLDAFAEMVAERHATKLAEAGITPPLMRCLTAPRSCAPTLLRLLSHEGVDGSSMYPGYDGVVRRLKERELWDDGTTKKIAM
jgi:hypothetical protein